MKRFLATLVLAIVVAPRFLPADEAPFPPVGDRYSTPSDDAKSVMKALSKLQARTEIAINFIDYDKAVADVYPDVKVFLDSAEAKSMPELRLLVANTMDCYLKARSIWSTSISSDSPIAKYEASTLLLTARPVLWKVAAANLTAAKVFLEGTNEERQKAQRMVADEATLLTSEAALVVAEEQLCELDRQSRAKESGVPVPQKITDADKKDLPSLLFAEGIFGNGVTAGPLKARLPRIFEKVPPAMQEGRIALLKGGESCGGVAGLIYPDSKTAKSALDAIAGGYGDAKQRVKGVGDAAVGVESPGASSVSMVFRRGPVVVSMQSPALPLANTVAAAKKLDERLAALFPGGAATSEEADEPADAGPQNDAVESDSLADLLFVEGDLSDSVTGGAFQEQVPPMFSEVPAASEQGFVPLTDLGKRVGSITAFVYDSEKAAKAAFDIIARGIGSQGAKISGVGSTAYASRVTSPGSHDIVFRRGAAVVHLRAPAKKTADLTTAAKRIDARIRRIGAEKAGAR